MINNKLPRINFRLKGSKFFLVHIKLYTRQELSLIFFKGCLLEKRVMKRSSRKSDTSFLEQLILYVASAAVASLSLYVCTRHSDPNLDAVDKALKRKKELAKRLGRPLIQTNEYEVISLVFST